MAVVTPVGAVVTPVGAVETAAAWRLGQDEEKKKRSSLETT